MYARIKKTDTFIQEIIQNTEARNNKKYEKKATILIQRLEKIILTIPIQRLGKTSGKLQILSNKTS